MREARPLLKASRVAELTTSGGRAFHKGMVAGMKEYFTTSTLDVILVRETGR